MLNALTRLFKARQAAAKPNSCAPQVEVAQVRNIGWDRIAAFEISFFRVIGVQYVKPMLRFMAHQTQGLWFPRPRKKAPTPNLGIGAF